MEMIINELNNKGIETVMFNNKLIVIIQDFIGFDSNWEEIFREDYLINQDIQLVKTLLKGLNYELHYSSEEI